MPAQLALSIWFGLLLALFWFDPAKDRKASIALWVPTIWIFVVASRLPAQWLNYTQTTAAAFEEGNPLDRVFYFALIILALGILISRSFRWGELFSKNLALTAFIALALVSFVWSDYAFITFKRWFRDLGIYLVILVALSDPRSLDAVPIVLRRIFYLLIPLSIVLIKYYPAIAIQYDEWTGAAWYGGACTSKNMLGVACLIAGLFFFWDTVVRWPNRKLRMNRNTILVNVAFIAMTLWLLNVASSATSKVCLTLGCLVVAAAHSKLMRTRPMVLKVGIPFAICSYALLEFGFGIDIISVVAVAVGRDPSLTGRTNIWDVVLSLNTNPLVGTGYESFWLGPRLLEVWRRAQMGLNEAHNGYLEVYLNLGQVGLVLLVAFLMGSYKTICSRLKHPSGLGSLGLALWTILLFYNVTESAFRGQLLFVIFLLTAIVPPPARRARLSSRTPFAGVQNDAASVHRLVKA